MKNAVSRVLHSFLSWNAASGEPRASPRPSASALAPADPRYRSTQPAIPARPGQVPQLARIAQPAQPAQPAQRVQQSNRHVLIDSIHDIMDQRRPHGTSQEAVNLMRATVRSALAPQKTLPDGKSTTSFENIRAHGSLLEVQLANGVTVYRTRQEAELHVLLQSQVRLMDPKQRDHGDSLAPPERNVASAALHRAVPRAVEGRVFNDRYENTVRIFDAESLDMPNACRQLQGLTHKVKSISSRGNNCWWRAPMLAAVVQRDPAALERTIVSKLGTDFRAPAAQLRRMGETARREGVQAIMTGMGLHDIEDDLGTQSRLKLGGVGDDEDGGRGEEACQTIVHGLLEHAEREAVKKGNDPDPDRVQAVFGDRMGEVHHVFTILNQLECDAAVLSRPWSRQPLASGGEPTVDFARTTIEVCGQPGSNVSRLPGNWSKSQATEGLLTELSGIPVLVTRGAHFNVCLPNRLVAKARSAYPG